MMIHTTRALCTTCMGRIFPTGELEEKGFFTPHAEKIFIVSRLLIYTYISQSKVNVAHIDSLINIYIALLYIAQFIVKSTFSHNILCILFTDEYFRYFDTHTERRDR